MFAKQYMHFTFERIFTARLIYNLTHPGYSLQVCIFDSQLLLVYWSRQANLVRDTHVGHVGDRENGSSCAVDILRWLLTKASIATVPKPNYVKRDDHAKTVCSRYSMHIVSLTKQFLALKRARLTSQQSNHHCRSFCHFDLQVRYRSISSSTHGPSNRSQSQPST